VSLWALSAFIIGGVLAAEGVMWALFPEATRNAYRQLIEMPGNALQMAGLISTAIGLVLVGLALHGLGG